MNYQEGVKLIESGKCPKGAVSLFCSTGHMLECHHPMNCEEAQCSHLERYQ